MVARGEPFDSGGRKQFEVVYCPVCGLDEQKTVMTSSVLAGPTGPPHEQLEAPTWEYRCPRCDFRMNYPQQLRRRQQQPPKAGEDPWSA